MSETLCIENNAAELTFEAAANGPQGDNLPVTAREWGSLNDCKAGVLLVHGLGAHSGWFKILGDKLAEKGFYSLAYDQVGFGDRTEQSFRTRKQWLADLSAAFDQLKSRLNGKPAFIIGNSMGAVVAIRGVNSLWPHGIALFSPGFEGHPDTFTPSYKVKAVTAAFVAPETELDLPYTVADITQNLTARASLSSDHKKRLKVTARMGIELLKLTMDTQSVVRDVPCPLLVATAGVERIVDNRVTERVFERITAPKKKWLHYADSWHDMIFEPVIDDLVGDVTSWMNEILNDSPE